MRAPAISTPELVAALLLVAVIAFALSSAFASGNITQRMTGTPNSIGVPVKWATLVQQSVPGVFQQVTAGSNCQTLCPEEAQR